MINLYLYLMNPMEGKVQAISLLHHCSVPRHVGHIRIALQVNLVHIYAKGVMLLVLPLLANVIGMGRPHQDVLLPTCDCTAQSFKGLHSE